MLILMIGVIGGVALDEWYRAASTPIAYAAAQEEVEPRIVLIKVDYTGWTKDRLQEEIRANLPEIFIDIAECESTTRQYDNRHEPLKGLVDADDTGVLQINKRYHAEKAEALGMDLDSPVGNIAYAKHLYETKGLSPWNSSKSCWSR